MDNHEQLNKFKQDLFAEFNGLEIRSGISYSYYIGTCDITFSTPLAGSGNGAEVGVIILDGALFQCYFFTHLQKPYPGGKEFFHYTKTDEVLSQLSPSMQKLISFNINLLEYH